MPNNKELLDKIDQLVDTVKDNLTTESINALHDACVQLPVNNFSKLELGGVARSMSRACNALYHADHDGQEAFALVHLGMLHIKKIKFNDFTSDNARTYLSFLNHLIFLNNNDKDNVIGQFYFNEMFNLLISNQRISKIFIEEHCDVFYEVLENIYFNVESDFNNEIPISFMQKSVEYIEKALNLLEMGNPNKDSLIKKEQMAFRMCKLLNDMHAIGENKIHYGLKQRSHALNYLELTSAAITMADLNKLNKDFIDLLNVSDEKYYNNLINLSRGLFSAGKFFNNWAFIELYSCTMKIKSYDKNSFQKIEALITFMEIVDLGIRHKVVNDKGVYILNEDKAIEYFQDCLSNLKSHLKQQKDTAKSLQEIVSNDQNLNIGIAKLVFSLKDQLDELQKENAKLSRKVEDLQNGTLYTRGGYRPTLVYQLGSSSTNSDESNSSGPPKKRRI